MIDARLIILPRVSRVRIYALARLRPRFAPFVARGNEARTRFFHASAALLAGKKVSAPRRGVARLDSARRVIRNVRRR